MCNAANYVNHRTITSEIYIAIICVRMVVVILFLGFFNLFESFLLKMPCKNSPATSTQLFCFNSIREFRYIFICFYFDHNRIVFFQSINLVRICISLNNIYAKHMILFLCALSYLFMSLNISPKYFKNAET